METQQVTYRNIGDEIRSGVFQDITFVINEKKHKRFIRRGADIIHRKNISLVAALAGFELSLKLLDNSEYRKMIDAVTHPGASLLVDGRGMPKTKNPKEFGNLIIEFDIEFPKSLTEKQKEAIRTTL